MQKVGVCNPVFIFLLFFWFLGFLVSSIFDSLICFGKTGKNQWEDLTLCHFYPFKVCKFVFGYFLFALDFLVSFENQVKTMEHVYEYR